MTERLYYTSDATECLARVVNCLSEADGRYAIELDRTLFHPQGGGQPADRGWIADLAVEGVVSRGDSVAHIVSQPLPSGEVTIRIDAESRRLHARLHSAGHVLAQAGEQSGWQPMKGHHWPGESRIIFAAGANGGKPARCWKKSPPGRQEIYRVRSLLPMACARLGSAICRAIPAAVRTLPACPSWGKSSLAR